MPSSGSTPPARRSFGGLPAQRASPAPGRRLGRQTPDRGDSGTRALAWERQASCQRFEIRSQRSLVFDRSKSGSAACARRRPGGGHGQLGEDIVLASRPARSASWVGVLNVARRVPASSIVSRRRRQGRPRGLRQHHDVPLQPFREGEWSASSRATYGATAAAHPSLRAGTTPLLPRRSGEPADRGTAARARIPAFRGGAVIDDDQAELLERLRAGTLFSACRGVGAPLRTGRTTLILGVAEAPCMPAALHNRHSRYVGDASLRRARWWRRSCLV